MTTRQEDIWYCTQCGNAQGRHDMVFTGESGDICEDCLAENDAKIDEELEEKREAEKFFAENPLKPRCHWCKESAERWDYREVDGSTSKIKTCNTCFDIATETLIKNKYPK